MKKPVAALVAFLLALGVAPAAQERPRERVRIESARLGLEAAAGRTERFAEWLASDARTPAGGGEAALAGLPAAHGAVRKVLAPEWREAGEGLCRVQVPMVFERSTVALDLVWKDCSAEPGALIAWSIVTYEPPVRATPAPPPPGRAPYVDPLLFSERPLAVGTADLEAVFTHPARVAPGTRSPAVLLLATDGPQDADGTNGEAKPLRDLAQALACNGVASLRFRKRAADEEEFDPARVTFAAEYLDDGAAALALLRTQPEVDPDSLSIVGHGLGAWAALRLAAKDPGIESVALLDPPAIFGVKTVMARLEAAGADDDPSRERLRLARQAARRAAAGTLGDLELFEGYGKRYWDSVAAERPLDDATVFSGPLLASFCGANRERDRAQWDAWKSALGSRPRTVTKWYEALDGRLVRVPQEGAREAPWVDPEPLKDLLEFLRPGRKAR